MTTYFDTSALLKLVIREPGSDHARELWNMTDAAVSSRLTYPEGRAALAAATRAGRIQRVRLGGAKGDLDRLWDQVNVVEVTEAVASTAGDLAEQLALRGYDAVHLASALSVGDPSMILATWDRELAAAARRAGLSTSP